MATKRPTPKKPRSHTRARERAKRRAAPKVRSFGAEDFRHRAFSLREQVKGLTQFMSLAELSRQTGIPRSTLSRYKKGGRPGRDVGELYAGILESGFTVLHREIAREVAAERKLPAIGKPVRVHRIDPRDPKRKKRIASDSVDRNVMNSTDAPIARSLTRAAQRARLLGIPGFVRFLILADETDPQYPGEYFWSEPESLADLTADEVRGLVGEARSRGTVILMRVQDRAEG